MKNLSNNGRNELIEKINDAINDGYLIGKPVNELHHEIFNTDYFIIGYFESEKWLKENYGIFAAIDTIKEYETDNFGEVNTDLSSSENVVNMLVYILGEELLNEIALIQENWDEELTEELAEEIKNELEEL